MTPDEYGIHYMNIIMAMATGCTYIVHVARSVYIYTPYVYTIQCIRYFFSCFYLTYFVVYTAAFYRTLYDQCDDIFKLRTPRKWGVYAFACLMWHVSMYLNAFALNAFTLCSCLILVLSPFVYHHFQRLIVYASRTNYELMRSWIDC